MKRLFKAGMAVATVSLAVGLTGTAAHATAPPPFEPAINTGWDGVPNTIIGQGSDTTFDVMNALSTLYNNAPGCQTYNGQQCTADDPADFRYGSTNYDHD